MYVYVYVYLCACINNLHFLVPQAKSGDSEFILVLAYSWIWGSRNPHCLNSVHYGREQEPESVCKQPVVGRCLLHCAGLPRARDRNNEGPATVAAGDGQGRSGPKTSACESGQRPPRLGLGEVRSQVFAQPVEVLFL